ncbi:MAG: aminodeoxychorismate synthase, component I, partial [Candidatus Marinimicrobia bacterium]|nr:aminodeoxychorismate synthase, component I [Candidatus Neomarinimicrobiota bacterium]MBT7831565.1 aminodeoxychorismate synthase, component I [Candidatus Neomarinimicrobiota bacterium]
RLRQDLKPIDALLSMLPGGSITGCPKKHAMEIIDELEDSSRGIYTGSMGYFHPDGDFSFNIAIRTLVQQGSEISLGSGGGITIDSNWEDEWDELMVKASTFK